MCVVLSFYPHFIYFLFSYFDTFAFQTITTERFLDYLDENLLQAETSKVSREDAEQWLYQPGLPSVAPVPHSSTLNAVEALASAWAQGKIDVAEIPVQAWSPQATIHFINSLPKDLAHERLAELDAGLEFSATRNAEIGRTWFIQVAQRRYTAAYEQLEQHLHRYGRGRLIEPVYLALAQNGSDLELAREMFGRARDTYHPLTESAVAGVLGLEEF